MYQVLPVLRIPSSVSSVSGTLRLIAKFGCISSPGVSLAPRERSLFGCCVILQVLCRDATGTIPLVARCSVPIPCLPVLHIATAVPILEPETQSANFSMGYGSMGMFSIVAGRVAFQRMAGCAVAETRLPTALVDSRTLNPFRAGFFRSASSVARGGNRLKNRPGRCRILLPPAGSHTAGPMRHR